MFIETARPAHVRRTTLAALMPAVLLLVGAVSSAPAQAAVVPGSSADLQINVAGPSAAIQGDTFTYTVTVENNSLPDADGASFTNTLPAGVVGVTATCAASAGAVCPATLSVSNSAVSGIIGALPHLGKVVVTITGRYSHAATSATDTATVQTPSGVTDPDPSSNTSTISTAIDTSALLEATKTVDKTIIAAGDVATYTLTYKNIGTTAADEATITDELQTYAAGANFGIASVHFVTCVPTAGAVCPTFTDTTVNGDANLFSGLAIPTFPAGSSIVITYEVTFAANATPDACTASSQHSISNFYRIQQPSGSSSGSGGYGYGLYTPTEAKPCPEVALTAIKTVDLTTISVGDTATYTVTFGNDGPEAADGTTIHDELQTYGAGANFGTADVHDFTCTSTNGAVCPTFTNSTVSGDGNPFNVVVPTFPANSTIVVTYQVTFNAGPNPNACTQSSYHTVSNYYSANAPAGVKNINGQTAGGVYTPTVTNPCAEVALRASKTVDLATINVGDTATYTVTVSNDGPGDASGASIHDELQIYNAGSTFGTADIHFTGCTPAGGAVCPTISDTSANSDSQIINSTVPSLPAGSSITITYEAKFAGSGVTSCPTNANGTINNYLSVISSADTTNTNGQTGAQTYTPTNCTELTVNKRVTPTAMQAGDAFTYTVRVTNAGPGTANAVTFTDPLVSGLEYGNAQCTVLTGAPTCGAVSFDAATNTVHGVIDTIAVGEAVEFVITGTAGVLPGTFTNTASVSRTAGESHYYDPNGVTDSSTVNVQIFNTVSPVTITKHIAGLSAAGLPAAKTFTGTVVCDSEGSKPWLVTVAAGAVDGSSTVQVFDGQSCTIGEDSPPVAPSGYAWTPTPLIEPAFIDNTGVATPVAVSVTNTLVPSNGSIIVTKQIAGLTAAGLGDAMTFGGVVTCTYPDGTSGAKPWTVTVAAGQAAGDSDPIAEPADSTCATTESTPPAAPAGFHWSGAPEISPGLTTVALDAVSNVSVTNTLAVTPIIPVGSLTVIKHIAGGPAIGTAGEFGFTAFCGTAGTFTTTTTVAKGADGTSSIINIPEGATCSIVEGGKSAAPAGFNWVTATVGGDATIVADDTVTVAVTNPLAAAQSSDGLASTGANVAIPLSAGGALGLLGVVLMLASAARRRREKTTLRA